MSLYCPNCNAELEGREVIRDCWNCGATFGVESSWHPTLLPDGPLRPFPKAALQARQEQLSQAMMQCAPDPPAPQLWLLRVSRAILWTTYPLFIVSLLVTCAGLQRGMHVHVRGFLYLLPLAVLGHVLSAYSRKHISTVVPGEFRN
jgi:hypothetical protein